MADEIVVIVEPPLPEILVTVEPPLPEILVVLSEVALAGEPGPKGEKGNDGLPAVELTPEELSELLEPPVDLILLFENQLV